MRKSLQACRSARAGLAAVALIGCGAGEPVAHPTAVTARSLYPLQASNAWSYDVYTGDGAPVLAITRVVHATPTEAEVVTGATPTRYGLHRDGITRIEHGGYLLRDPIDVGAEWPSGGERTATVKRVGLALDTPAGHFARCVEIREDGAASGAVIRTTYCPDVGPVLVRTETALSHTTIRVEARLRGYAIVGHSDGGSSATE